MVYIVFLKYYDYFNIVLKHCRKKETSWCFILEEESFLWQLLLKTVEAIFTLLDLMGLVCKPLVCKPVALTTLRLD